MSRRCQERDRWQSIPLRTPSTNVSPPPPPCSSSCSAQPAERRQPTRSPSPLVCCALNGWRSAAPPLRARQPQVRGALRRCRWPERETCTAPRSSPPYAVLCSPLLLRRWQSPAHAPPGRGRCDHQRHHRSQFSLRARPAESLGVGSIYTRYQLISEASFTHVPV